MIATTADCVALNPVGSIDIHGLGGMSPFFKGLLDKVGIKMQIIKVGTYKSAVEPFILTSMSEPAKEQMQQYLDSIWSYMSATMADNRGLSVDSIRAMASQMISTRQAETFIADGLADTLVYRRQSDDILRDYLGLDADQRPAPRRPGRLSDRQEYHQRQRRQRPHSHIICHRRHF